MILRPPSNDFEDRSLIRQQDLELRERVRRDSVFSDLALDLRNASPDVLGGAAVFHAENIVDTCKSPVKRSGSLKMNGGQNAALASIHSRRSWLSRMSSFAAR